MSDLNGLGSNSIAARPAAIRDALRECDRMDQERKELSARHKARKRLLVSELGVSTAYFELLRKIEKLEHATPGEVTSMFKDAFAALELGQQLDWIDAIADQKPVADPPPQYRAYDGVTLSLNDRPQPDEIGVEIPPPAPRRGRPPGSKNRPRVSVTTR